MKRAIAILLAMLMVLTLAACGGSSTTTPTPEATPEPAPEPTEEPMPEEIEMHLHQAATLGGYDIAITNVKFLDEYSTNLYDDVVHIHHTPKSDCYLRVDYSVKNTSKTKQYIPLYCMSVDYNDGYIFEYYKSYHGVSATFSGAEDFSVKLDPLSEKVSCRIYFDVPSEVRDSENPLSIIVSIPEGDDYVHARYVIRSGD